VRLSWAIIALASAASMLTACRSGSAPATNEASQSLGPSSAATSPATQPSASSQVSSPTAGTPDETILPAGGSRAASGLGAIAGCSETEPRMETLELRWARADQPGGAQRIDMTIYSELFDDGRYESSPLLAADQTSFDWDGVSPGAVHFWRVLTLQTDGWAPSETARFTPGACIGDYVTSPSP
jgi:hypothetical protein